MTRPYNEVARVRPRKKYIKLPGHKEITPEMTEMERRDAEAHNRALQELEEEENNPRRWKKNSL
jgi:hypothetical protein